MQWSQIVTLTTGWLHTYPPSEQMNSLSHSMSVRSDSENRADMSERLRSAVAMFCSRSSGAGKNNVLEVVQHDSATRAITLPNGSKVGKVFIEGSEKVSGEARFDYPPVLQ